MFADATLLLLTTTGAKTGAARVNPLVYFGEGDRYMVFASAGGVAAAPGLVPQPEGEPRGHRRGRHRDVSGPGDGARRRRARPHLRRRRPPARRSSPSTSRTPPARSRSSPWSASSAGRGPAAVGRGAPTRTTRRPRGRATPRWPRRRAPRPRRGGGAARPSTTTAASTITATAIAAAVPAALSTRSNELPASQPISTKPTPQTMPPSAFQAMKRRYGMPLMPASPGTVARKKATNRPRNTDGAPRPRTNSCACCTRCW